MRPDVSAARSLLAAYENALAAEFDPDVLAPSRRRISQMLGADDVSAVADPAPGGLAAAALAFTEQFLLDASNVSAREVDRLAAHLSPAEVYLFTRWVHAAEANCGVDLLLGAQPDAVAS